MKASPGSIVLVVALAGVFGVEIATRSVGNDALPLKLGALPDNDELNGQYWRFVTYSFLHFNWAHVLVNTRLLLWVGRILEKRVGTSLTGAIYACSVLSSLSVIIVNFIALEHHNESYPCNQTAICPHFQLSHLGRLGVRWKRMNGSIQS
jgi:membrane associated rhomboid family serine protease